MDILIYMFRKGCFDNWVFTTYTNHIKFPYHDNTSYLYSPSPSQLAKVSDLQKKRDRGEWNTETYVLTYITILKATRKIIMCIFLTKNSHATSKNCWCWQFYISYQQLHFIFLFIHWSVDLWIWSSEVSPQYHRVSKRHVTLFLVF